MRLKSMAFALLYSNLTAGKGAENMFTEKIELKDIDKMDPEYKDLLGRVLTIQADCEIGGPHLYVEKMLPAAPTKLDQLIVARTAAEEIDHFRKVARVAGDIGVDVSFVLSQPNEKRFVDTFRGLITTWGKTWHTWPDPSADLPLGEPMLMWSTSRDGMIPEAMIARRDAQFGISTEAIRKRRELLGRVPSIDPPKSIDDLGRQFTNDGPDLPPR